MEVCDHKDFARTWVHEGVKCTACDTLLDMTKQQDLIERNKRTGNYRGYWTDGCTEIQNVYLKTGMRGKRRWDDLSGWEDVELVGCWGDTWGVKWVNNTTISPGVSDLSIERIQWELRQGKLRFYVTDDNQGPLVEQPVEPKMAERRKEKWANINLTNQLKQF